MLFIIFDIVDQIVAKFKVYFSSNLLENRKFIKIVDK